MNASELDRSGDPIQAAGNATVDAQLRAFAARATDRQEPAWLTLQRAAGLRRFSDLGLPTRQDEAWRFNDLRPLLAAGGLPLPAAAHQHIGSVGVARHRLPGVAHRVVLVNGRFVRELSQIGELPPGVTLGCLADIAAARPDLAQAAFNATDAYGAQSLAALNAAFCTDGFILALEPDAVLPHPVEVLHVADATEPCAFHLRSAILAGARSRASVVETHVGSGAGWTNAVTTVEVGVGAVLHHAKLQAESDQATHTAVLRGRLEAAVRYEAFLLVCGARLSRQDVQIAMVGEDAQLVLNGGYLLRDSQEATIAPLVDHQQRGGRTSELLKGVIDDRAHGIFLGTVMVREGADGTDARQLNRNLMLSPTARVDSKPELTINADEVKCSHGATVGDLDEAALFYLLARGIDPATARHMLVEAFAAEVFDVAALAPDIAAHARRYCQAWLERPALRPGSES